MRQRLGSLMMLYDRGEIRTDFRPLPLTGTYEPCQQGQDIAKCRIATRADGHPAGAIDDLAAR